MKKIFKKITIFTVTFVLLFTVIVYAYNEGSGGSISGSGNTVNFYASVFTSLKANELNEISLIHEGFEGNTVLFRVTKIDRNQYYNRLDDTNSINHWIIVNKEIYN